MNKVEQRKAAKNFVEYWEGKGYERGDSQRFWLQLLGEVLGVEHPAQFVSFEDKVKLDHTSFIDGFIPSTHVLIEQKSINKDLSKPIKQSDGSYLTPFQQAKRYAAELPYSRRPRWIVVSNFAEFHIYDMEKPFGEPEVILLKNLYTEYYRLNFLVDAGNEHIKKELQISIEAGELVGKIYEALLKEYKDPKNDHSLKSLNMLCVRIVFCLYAEDAEIFGSRNMFHDYIAQYNAKQLRTAIIRLFKVLDTKEDERDPYLDEDLARFPYVNGGLFADEDIEIPQFTDDIRELLVKHASEDFDWKNISPTIFGAVFESTLNPETRRSGGMHYTSIENIHKVIDPLFLDELLEEFSQIKEAKQKRKEKLEAFQSKIANLTFLDPACGSGNFLTETYISLRRLENKILELILGSQIIMGDILDPVKVSIKQFYGIEINDFAVSVAKTALWIAESQMLRETEEIIAKQIDFLPLKTNASIHEVNALQISWEDVIPKSKLNYILGNPPFVGAAMMTAKQKKEAVKVFGKIKLANSIDYVGAWYYKAAEMMHGTRIKAAFVSTNSISQGEQVAAMWEPLFKQYGININFAYRTFIWDSEASIKAHVHCVIVGFSAIYNGRRFLFDREKMSMVNNINPFLLEAPTVFVASRGKPICGVPKLTKGNQPTDNGNLILSESDRNELLKNDSGLEICIRQYIGARDYLNNNEKRYCLWLKDISPSIYRKNKEILRRLEAVREFRLKSSAEPTRKAAEKPYQFFSTPQTEEPYLIIPRVSSERRKYIPMGFMTPDKIAADSCSIVCGANLYMFGVLTSNVHMAWMRTVAGRLKSDYRYSGSVVYNNFPWPTPTEPQKEKIKKTAQAILNARELYPESCLADLYDELTMPTKLREAHRDNDRAVMEAYGFWGKLNSEAACVAELMKMYQALVNKEK